MEATTAVQDAGTVSRWRAELRFLAGLVSINLSSAMEYRATFITQILGMFLNNGIYFVFWVLFFDRFGTVRGYNVREIYLLFAVVALSWGWTSAITGNSGWRLATIIAQGRLDYYLALPRALLPHVLCSHMSVSAIGDIAFGVMAFFFAGWFHPVEIAYFLLACVLAGCVALGFNILVGSAAFYMGNAQHLSMQASNAVLTFALYPNTLFSGAARLILLTLIPAAFIGGIPVQLVTERDPVLLLWLTLAAGISLGLGAGVFYLGLRRYESGSAINLM